MAGKQISFKLLFSATFNELMVTSHNLISPLSSPNTGPTA
jgi:hypothetical protein